MQRAPNHVPRWQLLGIWKSEMKIKVHWEQQSVRSFISNSTIAWRRLENHKSITRKRGMCDYRLLVPFRQLAVCVNTRKFLLAPAEMTQQGKARCWVFQCYVSCTENCAGAGWAYLDITWQTWHWTWPPGSLQSTFFLDWELSGMSNSTNMDTRVLLLSTVLPPGYVLSSVVDSVWCVCCVADVTGHSSHGDTVTGGYTGHSWGDHRAELCVWLPVTPPAHSHTVHCSCTLTVHSDVSPVQIIQTHEKMLSGNIFQYLVTCITGAADMYFLLQFRTDANEVLPDTPIQDLQVMSYTLHPPLYQNLYLVLKYFGCDITTHHTVSPSASPSPQLLHWD